MSTAKIHRDWQDLLKALNRVRSGRRLVFTNGCFDILHVGHVRYLQEARSLGDFLLVAINADMSVQKLKGPSRPVQNELARAEILSALSCVDFVTVFTEETPEALIQQVRPDVLVKGGDWKPQDIVGGPFVQSYGGEVRSLQFVAGFSTTSIIQKINS